MTKQLLTIEGFVIADLNDRVNLFVQRVWYGNSLWKWPLLPLSWLFSLASWLRVKSYRLGYLSTCSVAAPVVVVGNITAGGTGKTPVTLWLAEQLQARGYSPAIVSRGYGGQGAPDPVRVTAISDVAAVGDEPLLMAQRSDSPVYICTDRVRAAQLAVEEGASVVVSDDGLQHYRLERMFEIAVVDGARKLGNGMRIPAGPLREPVSRLAEAGRVLVQRTDTSMVPGIGRRANEIPASFFRLKGLTLRCLLDDTEMPIRDIQGRRVHAVAAIGNPDRFFDLLARHGLEVVPHALPDHAEIGEQDLSFDDGDLIVMTEKDAVKCRGIASEKMWYLPVEVIFEKPEDNAWLNELVSRISEWEPQTGNE